MSVVNLYTANLSTANVTSSAFLYCPPVTQTQFTTVYETVLPAACETSSWLATYTVTETCKGKKADYVTPTIPPGFVVTTVSCAVCAEPEMEITCPGAQPTGWGKPTYQVGGNGVTATITATPYPVHPKGPTAVPTWASIPPANQGSGSGYGTGSGSGCKGGKDCGKGTGSGSGYGTGSGNGNGNGYGTGSENGSGNNYGTGSESGSGSGSNHGTGSDKGCGGKGCGGGSANNNTWSKPPMVSGAAATIGRSLMVGAGLAFLAGPFLLL
ncbi:hypothetical protein GGS24DRAFT_353504 [Hypoxylon argillaceum]|nr:hypothetical protein GGS24DRAFT_353504 [Hypoxylon argillaceum]